LNRLAGRAAAMLAAVLLAAGCAAPLATIRLATAPEVHRYTGLKLCPGTLVSDLTSPREREAATGYWFHLVLALPPSCQAEFEAQLSRLAGQDCRSTPNRTHTCVIPDAAAAGATVLHATLEVTPFGGALYDVRFYPALR
jgi:hypothetical protein